MATPTKEPELLTPTNGVPDKDADDGDETAGRRMPDDLRTIGAIIRLLAAHDKHTAMDIMDYVGRRARRYSESE